MQRRTIGLVLLGIGAFLLVAAISVRLVLAPKLIALPLSQHSTSVAVASGATVFYPGLLEERSGVSLRAGYDVIGDADAPDAGPDVAVWTATSQMTDSNGVLIGVTEDRVCMDRRTGEAVDPCTSQRLNGDNRVHHAGLSYAFPFGTERRDYELFDTSAARAYPVRYVGDDEVEGLAVYKFEQVVPETVVERREVPGELAGAAEGTTVMAERVYNKTRTMWVEPTSGVPVNVREEIRQVLRGPGGTEGVTLLDASITLDDATREGILQRARDASAQITMLKVTLPIVIGVVGLFALVGGVLLVRQPRRNPVAADPLATTAPLRA